MVNSLDIILEDVEPWHKDEVVRERIKSATGKDQGALWSVMKYHYRSYNDWHWKGFANEWVPKADGVSIIYSGKRILAFAMWMDVPGGIYLRLLCSRDRCGGELLEHIIGLMGGRGIGLHSEPHTIGFYRKYGFKLTSSVYVDQYGIRYPYMLRGRMGDGLVEVGHHWPGIGYYMWTYWKVVICIWAGVALLFFVL